MATLGDAARLRRDAIFRIASLSKPIAAAAAMTLVDDGILAVADPVERFLPELADRRVLRSLEAPLHDTVPAERSVTVEDLLTFRLGFGAVMAPPGTYPVQDAEAELGLMTLGPPWPPPPFGPDEWMARFATLPLMEQPGARWRYNTGARCWGSCWSGRAGSRSRTSCGRVFSIRSEWWTPRSACPSRSRVASRRPTCRTRTPECCAVLDPPDGGWWNEPPAMANAAGMLVSTLDDFWAFVSHPGGGGPPRR